LPCSAQPRPGGTSVAVDVEVVPSGLDTVWAIDFAPDGRIFRTERAGRIRVSREGRLETEPWLVVPDVAQELEAGLLGFALDPLFQENGLAYAAYSYHASSGALTNR